MTYTGIIKFFSNEKGYGFAICDDESITSDVMIHYKNIIMDGFKSFKPGDRVQFEVQRGDRGYMGFNVMHETTGKREPINGSSGFPVSLSNQFEEIEKDDNFGNR